MIGTLAYARLAARKKAKEAYDRAEVRELSQVTDENVTVHALENDVSGTIHTDPQMGIRSIEGSGKCLFNDTGSKYKGNFVNSTINGDGKLKWSNGDVYLGQFHNGYRHGHGTLLSFDTLFRYEGEWQMGKRHGFGTLLHGEQLSVTLNGSETIHSKYVGSWFNDTRHGQGRAEWSTGQTYDGQWVNNEIKGSGCMRWPVEGLVEIYKGQFERGLPHGFGEFTWPSSASVAMTQQLQNRYIGQWVHGKRQGAGIYLYADGSSFNGEWLDNDKHGPGQLTLRDGRVFKSVWSAGVPATPVPTEADATLNPLSYLVDIDDLCETANVKRDVLSHLVKALPSLKVAYMIYKKPLASKDSEDPFAMTTLQFWNLLRDIDLIAPACSLVTLSRAILRGGRNMVEWKRAAHDDGGVPEPPRLYGGSGPVDVFSPDRILLFRHFVESLVRAAVTKYTSKSASDAVKTVLDSISLRRYVSESVFGMWSEVNHALTDDLWAMFASHKQGGCIHGRIDVTMTLRQLCSLLLKKGLLKSAFDKSQLEEALKVEIRQHSPTKIVTRKTTGLDEISISEGSLLGALRAETNVAALQVQDVDWSRCFTLGNVIHAAVQVISPNNVSHVKLDKKDCIDADSVSFEDLLSYDLCFFEFVRILYILIEVRADEVPGLKVDVDVTTRFRDFVTKILAREQAYNTEDDAIPDGWYKLKLDFD